MYRSRLVAMLAARWPGRKSKVCLWRRADGRYFFTVPYARRGCPDEEGAELVARRYPGHRWEDVS